MEDSSRPLRRCPGGTRGGEGEEFVGTGIDVTEQEHLTAALRKSEVELRQILDLAPQISVYWARARTLVCEPRCARLLRRHPRGMAAEKLWA